MPIARLRRSIFRVGSLCKFTQREIVCVIIDRTNSRKIKGDTSRFASPFESLNFFLRRSVHRASRAIVAWLTASQGKTRSGYTLRVFFFMGGRDGNAKTPRSTSRRAIRRCSKFFETALPPIFQTISFLFPRRRGKNSIDWKDFLLISHYHLDVNIACIISSRIIEYHQNTQLEDFSTYVKSSKIRVWKANTKVRSLINLFASTNSNYLKCNANISSF